MVLAVSNVVHRPSLPPGFDHLQYAKMEGGRKPGVSYHVDTYSDYIHYSHYASVFIVHLHVGNQCE